MYRDLGLGCGRGAALGLKVCSRRGLRWRSIVGQSVLVRLRATVVYTLDLGCVRRRRRWAGCSAGRAPTTWSVLSWRFDRVLGMCVWLVRVEHETPLWRTLRTFSFAAPAHGRAAEACDIDVVSPTSRGQALAASTLSPARRGGRSASTCWRDLSRRACLPSRLDAS